MFVDGEREYYKGDAIRLCWEKANGKGRERDSTQKEETKKGPGKGGSSRKSRIGQGGEDIFF